jgi:hypothetical protein
MRADAARSTRVRWYSSAPMPYEPIPRATETDVERGDYQVHPTAIVGGQADVYLGIRISDGQPIALKERRYHDHEGRARMRREIDVQRALANENVMPILDWDGTDYALYVMPRGLRTLADLATPVDDEGAGLSR